MSRKQSHTSSKTPFVSPAMHSLRRHTLFGVTVMLALFAGLGSWMALANLSGAVVATGKLVVESNVKDVQHPDGGIVGEIHVRDGDRVQAGDLLIRLDDTMARASLGIVDSQIDALRARKMRLVAERNEAKIVAVPDLFEARMQDLAIVELVAAETKLFEARRKSLEGEKDQLQQKLLQLSETIIGLEAQKAANEEESRLQPPYSR